MEEYNYLDEVIDDVQAAINDYDSRYDYESRDDYRMRLYRDICDDDEVMARCRCLGEALDVVLDEMGVE